MGSTPRGVSGSRIAAILGFSDYQSQFEVMQRLKEECYPGWAKAHGMILPENPDNAAIRFGTAFEDAIVELSEQSEGKRIGYREQAFVKDFLTCHIDGIYINPVCGDTRGEPLYEGKSTTIHSFHDAWGKPGTDRVPQGYQCQAQHNMALSGCERCRLSVLVFPRRQDEWEAEGWVIKRGQGWYLSREGEDAFPEEWAFILKQQGFFHQYDIALNRDAVALMHEAAAHFWAHYVVGAEIPDPRTYDDVRRAFPAPKGTIVADEQTARWAAEYRQIGEEIGGTGRLARRREELKVLILNWMRAQDATMDDDCRERTILRDQTGKKIAQFDGKVFRS